MKRGNFREKKRIMATAWQILSQMRHLHWIILITRLIIKYITNTKTFHVQCYKGIQQHWKCVLQIRKGDFSILTGTKRFPYKSSTNMTNQQQAFKAAKNPTNEKRDNLCQTSVQCFCSVILLTISKTLYEPEFDTTQHH